MLITKLTESMKEIVNQDHSMQHYLESLEGKVDFTPRSWLYDGEQGNRFLAPDAILKKWVSILTESLTNKDYLTRLGLKPEWADLIIQFDTAQLAKWGPQGGHAPMRDLLEDIVLPSFKGSENPKPSAFSTLLWRKAKEKTIRDLTQKIGRRVLRPASYKRVVEDMRARDTLESNSGFPDFRRRNLDEVKARAIADAESGAWRTYPAIALFRTYNGKTRLVWMFPMAANLVEGSYFQPLQSSMMRISNGREGALWTITEGRFDPDYNALYSDANVIDRFYCPWRGFEEVRKTLTSYMATETCGFVATDFSSTDAHFQKHATEEVFDVIKECFQKQYWDGLHDSLMYMHEIPLLIGPDSMITGDHGVSSGSNWTNFVETIFDQICANYEWYKSDPALILMDVEEGKKHVPELELVKNGIAGIEGIYAIGDDQAHAVFGTKFSWKDKAKSLTMNDWVKYEGDGDFVIPEQDNLSCLKPFFNRLGTEVGQEINESKVSVSNDTIKTLQRLFIRGYIREEDGLLRGVYSTIRALKSSVYPERFHNPSEFNHDMFCLRQFMILENCVDHPLFNELVQFICAGNRHLIPFAKKTRGQLEAIQRKSVRIPGLNSTYNQEKREQSIADFASIRVASKL